MEKMFKNYVMFSNDSGNLNLSNDDSVISFIEKKSSKSTVKKCPELVKSLKMQNNENDKIETFKLRKRNGLKTKIKSLEKEIDSQKKSNEKCAKVLKKIDKYIASRQRASGMLGNILMKMEIANSRRLSIINSLEEQKLSLQNQLSDCQRTLNDQILFLRRVNYYNIIMNYRLDAEISRVKLKNEQKEHVIQKLRHI